MLITIATGGGGSIAKIGTTATRATNAARRAATTARRILPNAADLADLRRIGNQKLDDLAAAMLPQPGLRPAWADNIHAASRMDGVPVRTQWPEGGQLPKRVPAGIAKQKIAAALKEWKSPEIIVGSKRIRITKERMDHFLKRHSPDHWYTDPTTKQSFFPNSWGVDEIESAIREALRQHRNLVDEAPFEAVVEMSGSINGRSYFGKVQYGEVVQFFME